MAIAVQSRGEKGYVGRIHIFVRRAVDLPVGESYGTDLKIAVRGRLGGGIFAYVDDNVEPLFPFFFDVENAVAAAFFGDKLTQALALVLSLFQQSVEPSPSCGTLDSESLLKFGRLAIANLTQKFGGNFGPLLAPEPAAFVLAVAQASAGEYEEQEQQGQQSHHHE